MALTVAERSRAFHARRRVTIEDQQRHAYAEKAAELRRTKVGTVAHFKRWSSRLRLDNGKLWVLEPFQVAYLRDLFAGREENWLLIPEGNAKTTLVAGVALYGLQFYLDAEIPVGASSKDQAGLLYGQAEGFIDRAKDDKLEDFAGYEKHPGLRRIEYLPTRSYFRIFAADDATGDGIIPFPYALIDELHRHRDLRLYRTWRGKLHKRGAQLVTISTAGEPGGEFEQTREKIRQLAPDVTRRGSFTRAASDSVLLHEWAVPKDADVLDVRVVKKANPLKAITLRMLQSKLDSPAQTMTHWTRFVCNIPTRSDGAAISEVEWSRARVDDTIPEGVPIWLGLDIGWKYDTTAAVPFWQRDADYTLFGPAKILIPPRDGQMIDNRLIYDALTAIHQRNPIHTIVMDTSFGAGVLAEWIKENLGSDIVERGQTLPQQVEEYDRFMEGLRTGWIHHTGDVGLTSHAMNAIARVNRLGATVFDRPNPTRTAGPAQDMRVIDALDAAAMVHAQAMVPVVEAFAFYG